MTDPNVKRLRRNLTPAERLLWNQLRGKRVEGRRFRRQYRIGTYVADFVCLPARLVVEVDGSQHELTIAHDERRTRWLEGQGFRVLRFGNGEVTRQLEAVVRTIEIEVAKAIATPPPESPSRKGRGLKEGVIP